MRREGGVGVVDVYVYVYMMDLVGAVYDKRGIIFSLLVMRCRLELGQICKV